MEFLKLAEERCSIRSFSPTPVEQEKLDAVLKAGRLAPTACNNQPQRILVLKSPEAMEKLKKCTPCDFGAPCALIVCYDTAKCWVRPFDSKSHGDIDASIVCTQMMLEATEQGLGSTWVCYFDPAAVVREFQLPESIIPSSILPLGYAAQDAKPAHLHYERQPLEATVQVL